MTERRRQEERSRATREALVAVARPLFAERGFTGVSEEEIVVAAGLTRGALRHHFGDKRELFRAVLERLERELTDRIGAELVGETDTWNALVRGFEVFLDACEDPEMVRIALTDAPAVLGWATWRAMEAEHGLGLITVGLERAVAEGILARQRVEILARLLLSAAIEAALLIAQATTDIDDRSATRREAERSLRGLLNGLRIAPQSEERA